MSATYAYGKYDKDGNLTVEHLYSDNTMVNISEDKAISKHTNFMTLANIFGTKGRTTLFKLVPIQTLES